VTLDFSLFAWLVATGWRRLPALTLYLPARKAAAAAAIVGALGYTLLAGFAVPAQRTFYMVTVVAIALWSGRIASPGRTLALALAAVVISIPGRRSRRLWLSFGAVMLIFYVASGWTSAGPSLRSGAAFNGRITVGLAPAVLLLFGQVSVAGARSPMPSRSRRSRRSSRRSLSRRADSRRCASPVLRNAGRAAAAVSRVVRGAARALWQQHVPPPWCVLLALGGAACCSRRGRAWRSGGLALMAPAFALAPPAPPTRRSLDHDARRRPGTRRAGPYFEPAPALRDQTYGFERGRGPWSTTTMSAPWR